MAISLIPDSHRPAALADKQLGADGIYCIPVAVSRTRARLDSQLFDILDHLLAHRRIGKAAVRGTHILLHMINA